MLCDRCATAFQHPTWGRGPYHHARRGKYNLQVLHPNFASLGAALDAKCGFCHRLVDALNSKRPSRILTGRQLLPDIDPDSFSVKYRFAYGAPSRRVITCTAIFDAKKAGAELSETSTEHLFLSPGKSDPTRSCMWPLTSSRTSSFT
jgi:hypothetical protein